MVVSFGVVFEKFVVVLFGLTSFARLFSWRFSVLLCGATSWTLVVVNFGLFGSFVLSTLCSFYWSVFLGWYF